MAGRPALAVTLVDGRGEVAAPAKVRTAPSWGHAEAVLDVSELAAGSYTLRVEPDRGRAASEPVVWPGRAKGWESVRVLNNFCWELLDERPATRRSEYSFTNPRRGWVWFRTESEGGLTLRVPGAAPEVVNDPGKGGGQEAMRWMEAGRHRIVPTGPGTLPPHDRPVRAHPPVLALPAHRAGDRRRRRVPGPARPRPVQPDPHPLRRTRLSCEPVPGGVGGAARTLRPRRPLPAAGRPRHVRGRHGRAADHGVPDRERGHGGDPVPGGDHRRVLTRRRRADVQQELLRRVDAGLRRRARRSPVFRPLHHARHGLQHGTTSTRAPPSSPG